MEMTKESVVASCKANGGYEAPHLNDQLYLHCKGYINIQHLEKYTNAKVLWLEQNAITSLSGMGTLQNLVSLFLQNNTIRSLDTFDAPLSNLRILNISHNYIASLNGLAKYCPNLETLQASHNYIASLEACEDLWALSGTLTSVDLSFNAISTVKKVEGAPNEEGGGAAGNGEEDYHVIPQSGEVADRESFLLNAKPLDPLVLVQFFSKLPLLSVIYMQGNPIGRGLRHYRRNMILHLPSLKYLDERPVFQEERRVVEAWGRGGEEAEASERAAIRDEKKKHLNSCVRVLTEKMEESREIRDRLTRQWEEKRDAELRALTQMRRDHKADREAFCGKEEAARESVEKLEEDTRWDIQEVFDKEREDLGKSEAANLHAYQQKCEVERVRREAEREIAEQEAVAAQTKKTASPSILNELMKTDDDVLREMEEEIDLVLGGVSDTTSGRRALHVDPSATSAVTTTKAERATHDAVGRVSEKLRHERRQRDAARQDMWRRFEEWEKNTAKKY